MPSIRDKSTIQALARAFVGNGRCKVKAMEEVGYTPAYANSYCGKMWENKALIEEIGRLDAERQANSTYTIELYQLELDQARQRAIAGKSHAAEVSAIVAKGRSMGYDKDNRQDTGEVAVMSEREAQARAKYAAWELRQQLAVKQDSQQAAG